MTPLLPFIIAAVIALVVYLAGLALIWAVVIGVLVLVVLLGTSWGWHRG